MITLTKIIGEKVFRGDGGRIGADRIEFCFKRKM